MRRILRCLAVLVVYVLTVPSVHATQDPTTPTPLAMAPQGPRFLLETKGKSRVPVDLLRTPSLQRRITVNLDGVSMRQALAEVARNGGIRLMYPDDVIPLSMPVRLRAESITVAAALTDLLMDAGVDVVFTPAGDASLVRRLPPPVGQLTGRVSDAKTGQALQGAEVILDGTKWRTFTDVNGKYQLTEVTTATYSITVRRVGYAKRTQGVVVADGAQVALDFALEPSAINLDELIVTGTPGGAQRRALGNAVSTLDAPSLVDLTSATNVGQLLNARAPGVVVQLGSGNIGAGSQITIRSRSSLSLVSTPLLYIDGVRVDNAVSDAENNGRRQGGLGRLSDIDPSDIESIEIIKGPSAATIYGTEAANGVIQIITKRARQGARPALDLTVRQGANWLMDAESRFPTNYWKNPATSEIIGINFAQREKDEGRPALRTGHAQDYTLALSGARDAMSYYVGAGVERGEGMEPVNSDTRFTGRTNLSIVPHRTLDIAINTSLTKRLTGTIREGGASISVVDALIVATPALLNTPLRGFPTAPPELLWAYFHIKDASERYDGSVQFKHHPSSWFQQNLTVGLDLIRSKATYDQAYVPLQYRAAYTSGAADGFASHSARNATNTTVDYAGTVTVPISHALRASTSVGAQYYRRLQEVIRGLGQRFPGPGLSLVNATATTTALEEYDKNITVGGYVQEQISWKDRLFLTGALRADRNSAFGVSYAAAVYPKASVSWVVSEEPFWKLGFAKTLRLRAAFGATGQQPSTFAAVKLFSPVTATNDLPGVAPQAVGNPDLKPERSEEFETGLEAGLFDGRLNLDFTYYRKVTRDAILLQGTAPSTGFSGGRFTNAGKVENHGAELLATGRVIASRNLDWDVTLNLSKNSNTLVDVGIPGLAFVGWSPLIRHTPGYPVASFFGRRVMSATVVNGIASNVLCDDAAGGTTPCAGAPPVFLGRTDPKLDGAVSTTLSLFKRIQLYALVDFKRGQFGQALDHRGRCLANLCEELFYPERFDPVRIAATGLDLTATQTGQFTQIFISDASFTKLREISVSLTLPDRWVRALGSRGARLTAAGRNLHTWTKWDGIDPETVDVSRVFSEVRAGQVPIMTQFLMTLKLTF